MEFLELPLVYQKGRQFIENECRKLIKNAGLEVDKIIWGKSNLSFCHLLILVGNKTHSVKFGKIALLQFEDPNMQRTILFKLKSFVDRIKIAKNNIRCVK